MHSVGRRTGRAELDEHAEGVHVSELDVDLKRSARSREAVLADIRSRLSVLPAAITVGQPIAHRIDHMLSGVRAQIALKIYGEDYDTLRALAADLETRSRRIPGIVDLQTEKQVRIPELQVRVDYEKAKRYGLNPSTITESSRRCPTAASSPRSSTSRSASTSSSASSTPTAPRARSARC